MSQNRISGIIFCILLTVSVFVLGYLIGANQNTKSVKVTYASSVETTKENVEVREEEQTGEDGRIDLNTADQAQLETLPGIGPELASRILEYRAENGGFESVEELKNVNGIGEVRYSEIADLVTVGGAP